MNAIELLRQQFNLAHEVLGMTIADVTDEVAQFTDTGKALPVGAAYAHAVIGEDLVLSHMVTKKTPVFTTADDAGVSEAMPDQAHWEEHEAWAKSVKVDFPKFAEYAKKVYAATDEYLAGLSESDLEKKVEVPGMGTQNLAWLISGFLLLHMANLTGEISAAKGVQGLKGYPF